MIDIIYKNNLFEIDIFVSILILLMDISMDKFVIHKNTWTWGESNIIITSDGTGTVTVQFFNDETDLAYITGLSVYSKARNNGLGKTLLHKAEKIAKEREGIKRIKICCDKNTFVYDWYVREGYKDTGIILFGYGDTVVELIKNID